MAFVNNVVFVSAAGGGTFTVLGPVPGYQTPASAGAVNGKGYRYRAQNEDMSEWELGTAVSADGGVTYSRAVLVSSNGGADVDFTTTPTVMFTWFGGDVLSFDEDMGLTAPEQLQGRTNVGLGNVDNTADADKPVSTAQAAADAAVAAAAANADNLTSGTVPDDRLVFTQSGTGAVPRTYSARGKDYFLLTDFDAKGDNVIVIGATTIGLGSSTLTVAGADFATADIGKAIYIPGAGVAGAKLSTTIVSRTSSTVVGLAAPASTALAAVSKRIVYGTDDAAAIAAAVLAARTARRTLLLPDGNYGHVAANNWAWEKLKVLPLGENARFVHNGLGGNANIFSGMLNYPGISSQGCAGMVFGGGEGGKIFLEGSADTGNNALFDNFHFGVVNAAAMNAYNAAFIFQDTGSVALASAVETYFDLHVTPNATGAFTVVPLYAIYGEKIAACIFNRIIFEAVGSAGTAAMHLIGCNGNVFDQGTIESCAGGGAYLDVNSGRNTFIGLHNEVNGAGRDWDILGDDNVLIGCAGAATALGSRISGDGTIVLGGGFQSLEVTATAAGTMLMNVRLLTAFTNGSTSTSVINPRGGIATAIDHAPVSLGNKSFNTDNGNTLYVASHQIAAVTGTGATMVASISPALTTPDIGAATATTINGAALNNNAWTSYSPTLSSSAGTLASTGTTATVTGRYKQIGKTVFLELWVVITTIGTASGAVICTLPFTAAAFPFVGTAFDFTVSAESGAAIIAASGTTIASRKANGVGIWWVNTTQLAISATYEVP